jgi:hypothetical protein
MNFVTPTAEELAGLRIDPLLFEQELDIRPSIAEALEKALGFRAGRRYWRSESNILYAIDLADLGRGRPSMALVYAFWPRFEPRPLSDEEIDFEMSNLCLWLAEICEDLNVEDVRQVIDLAWAARNSEGKMRLFQPPS